MVEVLIWRLACPLVKQEAYTRAVGSFVSSLKHEEVFASEAWSVMNHALTIFY